MQYLRIKPTASKTPNRKRAVVIKKNRKFGQVLEEKSVSVKRAVLLVGAAGSGKSYWLSRFFENGAAIWDKSTVLFIDSTAPLSSWVDNQALITWYEKDGKDWKKAKSWTRIEALPAFIAAEKVVFFVDDAHLLTGRKSKIVTECVKSGRIFVMTTTDEGRLNPSLRQVVLNALPQIFRLDSDVAFDATPVFIWLCVLICLGVGHWELAGILGGLQAFSKGRGSTKQV
jgi:hypothetical protein